MRITHLWSENTQTLNSLKISCVCLLSSTLVTSGLLYSYSGRPPVIIERSCTTQTLSSGALEHTEEEIQAFITEAIKARFNSDSKRPELLTVDALKNRNQEQLKFEDKSIRQTVIVEKIEVFDESFKVYSTRLISVENIRSAFPFVLKVLIKNTERSASNPYGIVLSKVSEIQTPPEKGK